MVLDLVPVLDLGFLGTRGRRIEGEIEDEQERRPKGIPTIRGHAPLRPQAQRQTRLPPDFLARYMAWSAPRMSSSVAWALAG